MTERKYSSKAGRTTLSAGITDTDGSMTLSASPTSLNLPSSFPYTLVIDVDTNKEEIVEVTSAGSGNTLNISRGVGVDGSTAQSHDAGAVVAHMATGRDFREPQQHIAATAGVHGVTGTLADMAPAGAITMFGGLSAPSGWLLCNGQAVSRTTYASLFAVIGETYGAGDGSTTFALPNFQGKVPAGYQSGDTDFGSLGTAGGSKVSTAPHTHDIDHNHAAFNATSGNASQGHTHGLGNHTHSGTTASAGDHGHWSNTYDRTAYGSGSLVAKAYQANSDATSINGAHQHTFSTGGPSTNTSDGQSQSHTHTTSIDVPALGATNSGPSSAAATSGNLQPYLTVNYIIKH